MEAVADTAVSPTAVHHPSMAITRNPAGNFPPPSRGGNGQMAVIGNAQAVRASPPPISQEGVHVALSGGPPPRGDNGSHRPQPPGAASSSSSSSSGSDGSRPGKLRESKYD